MKKVISINWMEYGRLVEDLGRKIKLSGKKYTSILGVPTGGIPIAVFLSKLLSLPYKDEAVVASTLVVDDISDTGETLEALARICDTACLFSTPWTKTKPTYSVDMKSDKDSWIIFPYEMEEDEVVNAD